jgi:TPR repeat protein
VKNKITLFFLLVLLFFSEVEVAWPRRHAHTTNQATTKNIQSSDLNPIKLLHSHQFVMLDRQINALQTDYEQDTEREFVVSSVFSWFKNADPSFESLLQEWLNAYPESYAANLAMGIYYMAMAAEWRGVKYINEIPRTRIENMDRYLEKAVIQFEKSLRMTEKPILSYTYLIAAARYHGDGKASKYWLSEALKCDPYCIRPRSFYMHALEPRWGGSYDAMRAFAEETRRGGHPKLDKAARYYEAWIHWYSGYQKYLKKSYVDALDEYQKALAIYDDSGFRLDRAKVYQLVGQIDLAMADINRGLELDPLSTELLYFRGTTLLDKRQTAEALNDLRLSAEYGNMKAVKKLGDLYTSGDLGVPLNVEEGMKLWEKAAYFWDEDAAFALAGAYSRGLGVKVDNVAAVRYLRIAAEQDHGLAINNLGLMLWYGRGAPANRKEAVRLWIIGAKKDIWQSKHNLQFFLSPLERFKIALDYPQIFLEDKKVMFMSIASILVVVFLAILLLIVFMRIGRTQ